MSKSDRKPRAKPVAVAAKDNAATMKAEETAAIFSVIAAKSKISIERMQTGTPVASEIKSKRKAAKPKKKAKTREGKRGIVVHVPHEMGDALKDLADRLHIKLEALAFEALRTLLASHQIAPLQPTGPSSRHDDEGRPAHAHR